MSSVTAEVHNVSAKCLVAGGVEQSYCMHSELRCLPATLVLQCVDTAYVECGCLSCAHFKPWCVRCASAVPTTRVSCHKAYSRPPSSGELTWSPDTSSRPPFMVYSSSLGRLQRAPKNCMSWATSTTARRHLQQHHLLDNCGPNLATHNSTERSKLLPSYRSHRLGCWSETGCYCYCSIEGS